MIERHVTAHVVRGASDRRVDLDYPVADCPQPLSQPGGPLPFPSKDNQERQERAWVWRFAGPLGSIVAG